MLDSLIKIISHLTDRTKKLSDRVATVLLVLVMLFLFQDYIGFLHNYKVESKIEQLKGLKELGFDDAELKNEEKKLKTKVLSHKSLFEKVGELFIKNQSYDYIAYQNHIPFNIFDPNGGNDYGSLPSENNPINQKHIYTHSTYKNINKINKSIYGERKERDSDQIFNWRNISASSVYIFVVIYWPVHTFFLIQKIKIVDIVSLLIGLLFLTGLNFLLVNFLGLIPYTGNWIHAINVLGNILFYGFLITGLYYALKKIDPKVLFSD